MRTLFTLSKKEREVMEIFWDAGCQLSRSEILERASMREHSWKLNSIHILINSLLEKKALRVAGFYLNCRKLGRVFEAAITPGQYVVMQVEIAIRNAQKESGLNAEELLEQLPADLRGGSPT